MWRSFWRSIDRFSPQHFKYLIAELQRTKAVNQYNRELIIDILQSIVEIVTYGDRHDPSIFECFMEYQVLAEFLRILKISRGSLIEISLLQYLSIMIQNLQSDQAIYYCFSNEYLNSIILHQYNFSNSDLASYYISFLRAVSGKLNRDTLCLLVKVQEDAVTSFPLIDEAFKFAQHGEKMIQTAVRALTLNILNVSDDMVYQYITRPPASEYFSNLVLGLRKQCLQLDAIIGVLQESCTPDKRNELISGIDRFLDDLYYVKDLFCVGESHLSNLVSDKLLGLLVVPLMIPLMQLKQNLKSDVSISAITSLFILSRILQVVDGKEMVHSIASLVLYPHVVLSLGDGAGADSKVVTNGADSPPELINNIEEYLSSSLKSAETIDERMLRSTTSDLLYQDGNLDNSKKERIGIMSYIFGDSEVLLFASLMLLLILEESKELDHLLSSAIGFPQTIAKCRDASVPLLVEESIFMRCMPEILNALFKSLGTEPAHMRSIQWHAGWFLQKLIVSLRAILNHQELHFFNIRIRLNASFHQSRERLLTELKGCWFDVIPETFKKEWAICKTALEESSLKKDPFFLLDLSFKEQSGGGNVDAWQRMLNVVKIFVLHLHLKVNVLTGHSPIDPVIDLKSKPVNSPRRTPRSDVSSASFGSEVPLGSGIPCKIAFSKLGVRDIYMLPVSKGIIGKLLLVEKHPFHSRNGLVLAKAPLAGLNPMMDESHPTWLHLHIREPNPKQIGKSQLNSSNHEMDGRWTLGFSDAETCNVAYLLVVEEISKQRSYVESLLAPYLYDTYLGHIESNEGGARKLLDLVLELHVLNILPSRKDTR